MLCFRGRSAVVLITLQSDLVSHRVTDLLHDFDRILLTDAL